MTDTREVTRCTRCGKSTKSKSAKVCKACLLPSAVRAWILKEARMVNDCLIASINPHSDGMFRVTVLDVENLEQGTKTSRMLHVVFNNHGLEVLQGEQAFPTCGNWGCVLQGHWAVRETRNIGTVLKEYKSLLQEAVEVLRNDEAMAEFVERIQKALYDGRS